jgi:Tol biopolymer transport system component
MQPSAYEVAGKCTPGSGASLLICIAVACMMPPACQQLQASSRWTLEAILGLNQRYKFSRLYAVPVGGSEPKLITTADRHVTGFDWSPDGSKIVYAAQATPGFRTFFTPISSSSIGEQVRNYLS